MEAGSGGRHWIIEYWAFFPFLVAGQVRVSLWGLFFHLPSTLLIPGKFYLIPSSSHLFSLLFSFPLLFIRREVSGETLLLFHFFRLGRIPEAEDLASLMLKGFPRDRVSAQEALAHDYFSSLPSQLHQLPDGQWGCGCVWVCARVCARAHSLGV